MNESRPASMSSFWMPFTNNRDFKANPRLLVSAEGMYYKDVDGNASPRRHRRPVVRALRPRPAEDRRRRREMIGQLDFAPTFQMGHPAAFDLAERLMDYTATSSATCSIPTPARKRSTPR
jgi:beta-alanine--pyruvate transaminase